MNEVIKPKDLVKLVEKWSEDTSKEMGQILKNHRKGNSEIAKKLKLEVSTDSYGITVESKLPDYAIFVDKGRGPGKQPPLINIINWCKRKGINEDFAFPIARNIGERGLPPTNFLDPLRDFKELIEELQEMSVELIKENIINKIET